MKLASLLFLGSLFLPAQTPTMAGAWRVVFQGDPRTEGLRPMAVILLDLHVEGDHLTGKVRLGSWPGEAPIAKGRVEGDRANFLATGTLDSTTGIPTSSVDLTLRGDELLVTVTFVTNPPGFAGPYRFAGRRISNYAAGDAR